MSSLVNIGVASVRLNFSLILGWCLGFFSAISLPIVAIYFNTIPELVALTKSYKNMYVVIGNSMGVASVRLIFSFLLVCARFIHG